MLVETVILSLLVTSVRFSKSSRELHISMMTDTWLKVFDRLLFVGGIAGVVALVIAGSICIRYVQHGPEASPRC